MYTIINCGFYEGKQNNVAFKIIENWCEQSNIKFGGGIGQGGGEMLRKIKKLPNFISPFKNFERELQRMMKKVILKEYFGVIYLTPIFPLFLFKYIGTINWNIMARKNGLKKNDIIKEYKKQKNGI